MLGLVAIYGALRPAKIEWRLSAAILGVFWCWNGFGYQFTYFARINPAAYAFAALFTVQGILFFGWSLTAKLDGVGSERVQSIGRLRWIARTIGLVIIAYAMLAYPILGILAGHGWPRSPAFGIAPCPTTIFTFGILLLWWPRTRWWLIVLPLIWAAIGSTAAVLLSVPEDLGLLVSGIIAASWFAFTRSSYAAEHPSQEFRSDS
ncbi:MAG: hypothetical protein HY852_14295 [Bradyrhizobium sp.]|nr:hypothetical protein [Bradyrhizobium sp.]